MPASPSRAVLWRATAIIGVASMVAALAVIPLAAHLSKTNPAALTPRFLLFEAVQTLVVFSLLAAAGLFAARHTGLPGAPLVTRLAGGPPAPPLGRALLVAAGLGLVGGALIIGLDMTVFGSTVPAAAPDAALTAFVRALVGGVLYGGIAEEAMMRLGLLSVLVLGAEWLLTRGERPLRPGLRGTVRLVLVVVVALVFGLSHLPITSTFAALTTEVVVRAIVLNGIVGVICGLLYLRHGYETAAVAHAASHIPIQCVVLVFATLA